MSATMPVDFMGLVFDDAEPTEDAGYAIGFIGESRGSADAVKTVLTSLWRDGDNSRINHFGNRVVTCDVEIVATDSVAATNGETALGLACAAASDPTQMGTLTFPAFDDVGFPTVWDVLNAYMDPVEDDTSDLDEIGTEVYRVFRLTLECRPWPRSATLTTATWTVDSNDPTIIPIDVVGAVRTEAALTFTGAGSANIETLIVFTDPALDSYDPSDSSTWQNAPEGLYEVWLKNPGVAGDVLTASVGGGVEPARTRLDGSLLNWAPIGTLDLGGRRDGTLGTFALTIKRNGTTVVSPTVRLFRRHDTDTALLFMEPFACHQLIVDCPGVGHPLGGIWGDGVALLDGAIGWDFPQLIPATTHTYVEGHANASVDITVLVEYYARWQMNAGA